VKEENIGLPKIENHQDENIIACIDKIYNESFNKSIDFGWMAKSVVLVVGKIVTIVRQRRFPRAQTQSTIRYTPTSCTTTIDEDLDWTNFASIFDLINTNVFTYEHALNKFLHQTHFLFSWFEPKKNRGVPFVRFKHTPPKLLEVGPRKPEAS
jgi:hypothetical protein